MSKHTPGEWIRDGVFVITRDRVLICDCRVPDPEKLDTFGFKPILEGNGSYTGNTNLIITAPKLLEQCKILVSVLKEEGFFPDLYESAEKIISEAEHTEE